jgi:hypothetical protein
MQRCGGGGGGRAAAPPLRARRASRVHAPTPVSPPRAPSQELARLARAERRRAALAERRTMCEQVDEAYRGQWQRQLASGDGFFVVAAFYGAARAVRELAADVGGGRPVDVGAALARHRRRGAPAGGAALRDEPAFWGALLDVAGALQARVEVTARDCASESAVVQLLLPAGSKAAGAGVGAGAGAGAGAAAALDGVWDPADGEEKALWLRYEFLGRVHEALIDDEAPLKCPLKSAWAGAGAGAGGDAAARRAAAQPPPASLPPLPAPLRRPPPAQSTSSRTPRRRRM